MAKLAECSNRGGGAVIAPDAAGGPIIRGRAPAEAGSVVLGVRERAWRFREGPVTQRTMQAAGPELGDAVMNDLRPELALAIPWKGDVPATHASKTLGAGALAEPSPSAESPPVVSEAPDKV